MHQRQIIRTAIQTILLGETSAGDRVYRARFVGFRKNELPAIGIYFLRENSDFRNSAPREYERRATIAIEGIVRCVDNQPDDIVDNLAEQIEILMDADPTLSGSVSDSFLTASEMEFFENGDQHIAAIRLSYDAKYFSCVSDDGSVTLEKIDAKFSLNNNVEVEDQAEDFLNF
jgi:hypothetical protein